MRFRAWMRLGLSLSGYVLLAAAASSQDAHADNCSATNPSDCQTVPTNVIGTLGAAGVAGTLGLLNGGSGSSGEGDGEDGSAEPKRSRSFLDDF
jgi:hypothetical protein